MKKDNALGRRVLDVVLGRPLFCMVLLLYALACCTPLHQTLEPLLREKLLLWGGVVLLYDLLYKRESCKITGSALLLLFCLCGIVTALRARGGVSGTWEALAQTALLFFVCYPLARRAADADAFLLLQLLLVISVLVMDALSLRAALLHVNETWNGYGHGVYVARLIGIFRNPNTLGIVNYCAACASVWSALMLRARGRNAGSAACFAALAVFVGFLCLSLSRTSLLCLLLFGVPLLCAVLWRRLRARGVFVRLLAALGGALGAAAGLLLLTALLCALFQGVHPQHIPLYRTKEDYLAYTAFLERVGLPAPPQIVINGVTVQKETLAAPALRLVRENDAGMRLSWDAVEGATGYSVYRGDSPETTAWYAKSATPGYYDPPYRGICYYQVLAYKETEAGVVYSDRSLPVSSAMAATPTEFAAAQAAPVQMFEVPEPSALSTASSGRLDIWETALQIWAQSPVFGVGQGDIYNRYVRLDPLAPWGYLHNGYVQILTANGAAGLGLFLGFLCLLLLRGLRLRHILPAPAAKRQGVLLCALLGMCVFNVFESSFVFGLDLQFVCFWFWAGPICPTDEPGLGSLADCAAHFGIGRGVRGGKRRKG